jgi:hypothetical protein
MTRVCLVDNAFRLLEEPALLGTVNGWEDP